MNRPWVIAVAGASLVATAPTWTISSAPAHADDVAYLVNVTVRPGYGFASAEDALGYGRDLCRRIELGESYDDILAEIEAERGFSDDYQAGDLVGQAANELCPAQIWTLRRSTAGRHTPPATPSGAPEPTP